MCWLSGFLLKTSAIFSVISRPPLIMEVGKSELRFYIYMRFKLGESATQIHNDLCTVITSEAPSYRTVADWMQKFRDGREELHDEPRSGRPVSATDAAHVQLVRAKVEEDHHIAVFAISEEVGISTERVRHILHHELNMRKICARWIPHRLTPEQKANRVTIAQEMLSKLHKRQGVGRNDPLDHVVTGDETWMRFYQVPGKQDNKIWVSFDDDDERPTIVRTGQGSKKRMFAVFFSSAGRLLQAVLPQGQTVTGAWYQENCVEKVKEKVQHLPGMNGSCNGFLFHHDNAAAHKSALVQHAIISAGFVLLPQPPYSPDLSPADYWLFPKLKAHLSGRHFDDISHLARASQAVMDSIPATEYRHAFQQWIYRLEKCVQMHGEYFEGL